jgi:hypothetical protein
MLYTNQGIQSINSNRNAWDDLSSELKMQLAMLEDYQKRLDGHPCNLDLTPIQALEQYVKYAYYI